jgi:hypothetical protein
VIKDSVRVGIKEGEFSSRILTFAPTVSNGTINLAPDIYGDYPGLLLIDVTGRVVQELHPGINRVRKVGKGVFFIQAKCRHRQVIAKVILY